MGIIRRVNIIDLVNGSNKLKKMSDRLLTRSLPLIRADLLVHLKQPLEVPV